MNKKVVSALCVAIWQILISIYIHLKNQNKIYDLFNAIYQLILFSIFQIIIWLVL